MKSILIIGLLYLVTSAVIDRPPIEPNIVQAATEQVNPAILAGPCYHESRFHHKHGNTDGGAI
jgi:hypothetical protein